MDNIRNNLSERQFSGEEAQDLIKCRHLMRNIDFTYEWERMRKKKRKK